MQFSKMNMVELSAALAAASSRLTELRSEGFLEDGTLIVTIKLQIGRLNAEIAGRVSTLKKAA